MVGHLKDIIHRIAPCDEVRRGFKPKNLFFLECARSVEQGHIVKKPADGEVSYQFLQDNNWSWDLRDLILIWSVVVAIIAFISWSCREKTL